MTTAEFKTAVQAIFPFPFAETLIVNDVDSILSIAVLKACSRYEKIVQTQVTSAGDLPQAIAVTKVVPSTLSSIIDVFYYLFPRGTRFNPSRVDWYFTPERRLIFKSAVNMTVYVEYVKDPKFLTVEDLNMSYLNWAINYANALLKIKEGYLGTAPNLGFLPFDFNYESLKTEGQTEKETLEAELEEMYSGLFPARS